MHVLHESGERPAVQAHLQPLLVLHDLTEALSLAGSLEQVYTLASRGAQQALGADRVAICLLHDTGRLRAVVGHGITEPFPLEPSVYCPWPAAATDARPIVVNDVENAPDWQARRADLCAYGIRALVLIPILRARRAIGSLILAYPEPLNLDALQLQVARNISQQISVFGDMVMAQAHLEGLQQRYDAASQARVRAEIERRREREAREAAETSLRTREKALAIVSHDLRTPLNAIVSGADTLLLRTAATEGFRDLSRIAGSIREAGMRMGRLIEDLLDLERIKSGGVVLCKQPYDIATILDQVLDSLSSLAIKKALRLLWSAPDPPLSIACDRERICQVLSNLVSNAIHFTPPAGEIYIRVEQQSNEAIFYVSDTGPGIPADALTRVFDPYWQAECLGRDRKGLGLGLSIARSIVHAHHGRIWTESVVGEGALFVFTLPLEA